MIRVVRHVLGQGFEMGLPRGDRVFVFFGNAQGNLEKLKIAFPKFQFWHCHQVHSAEVIELGEPDFSPEQISSTIADGMVTSLVGQALSIKTADCLPVFLLGVQSGKVAALHAGWRGLDQKIVPHALEKHFHSERVMAFSGPAISQGSYEVGAELLEKFPETPQAFRQSGDRLYFDLKKVLRHQLRAEGIDWCPRFHFTSDVYRDKLSPGHSFEYHSFRRDGPSSGRNISFVVRLA